jgi:hypothetical protein
MMLTGFQGWQGRKTGKATSVASSNRFFHWFLEFPEVMNEGGFDCILGNPPFLGGQKLSGSFGYDFLEYLRTNYFPLGAEDLVSFFFRRIYGIIKKDGFLSLISTNTVAQGKAREGGLDIILGNDGRINHAVKGMPWPGIAKLEVSLITITKGRKDIKCLLNSKEVNFISSFLDSNENNSPPNVLNINEKKAFQGSIILGEGFILTKEDAIGLIKGNSRNKEVLFPYLNGDDLNSNIDQKPSRWVINFFNWSEGKAKEYTEVYNIALSKVKPQRLKIISDKEFAKKQIGVHDNRSVEEWWKYLRPRPELYGEIKCATRVMVQTRVSKILAFEFCPNDYLFSDATLVFNFQDFCKFCILQSNFHECWARKYSSTLESRMRYSVSESFQTFPFPQMLMKQKEQKLELVGEQYHSHRRQLMLSMQLGLTKTYNAFHAKEITANLSASADLEGLDKKAIEKQYGKEVWNLWNHLQKTPGTCTFAEAVAGIVKLRELHVVMDQAVLEAYGWLDVKLRHDFYEVDYLPENDRVRYTIHPEARKEILKRLLELNHQIHEEEVKAGLWDKKKAGGKEYKKATDKGNIVEEPEEGYGQGRLF